ncbi:hypothetical protein EQG63_03060 [Flavobacterium amnicola]|uniref:Uncharacterized protein n=1 Tax=Flavobacterium amnicola TaxID=2506422 RepID=A0A4V1N294_9FLAO|nr:hypothetical protein [Flavobacterium amnicola]RXR20931.1 hypothetical protein EQG63_03060 [Flavobacterium amnicola]
MRKIVLILSVIVLSSFGSRMMNPSENTVATEVITGGSVSLINDTNDKVSIHTGTGFVSLNKGAKTSIGCNVGEEVRWADNGKKAHVIFTITEKMCGKTFKLSELMLQ